MERATMVDFAHLHLHTLYSLLDGAIRMKDLMKTVKEKGMDTVAVTDHGNMFATVDYYLKAKEAGIKPIFGSEMYVAGPKVSEPPEVIGPVDGAANPAGVGQHHVQGGGDARPHQGEILPPQYDAAIYIRPKAGGQSRSEEATMGIG